MGWFSGGKKVMFAQFLAENQAAEKWKNGKNPWELNLHLNFAPPIVAAAAASEHPATH